MKTKQPERVVNFSYEDIDKRLSEIHQIAAGARDQAQAVLSAIGAYKSDLLSAEVKRLEAKALTRATKGE